MARPLDHRHARPLLVLMPIYLYEVIAPEGHAPERFEVQQSMTEPALTHHPISGLPVRKVFTPPNLATRYTPGNTRAMLDNKSVEKAGFTKYERDKLTGRYHRVAGSQGPASFSKPTD